jgi:hypothetical protein
MLFFLDILYLVCKIKSSGWILKYGNPLFLKYYYDY